MFIILSVAKTFINNKEQFSFFLSISEQISPGTHMETFKEADNPESIKSHSSKKLIWKFNFILFIAMMWAVCQAILTVELFFCTDQDLQSP